MVKSKYLSSFFALLPIAFFAVLAVPSAWAAEEGLDSGDTAWILTATALVLFMTLPGLSLFYGGLVRSKSVLTVLMQCFAIACLASLLWFVVGYSLAFGEGSPWVGDFSHLFFMGIEEDTLAGTIPESVFASFQMTFAIITPALIVGAFAERVRFSTVLLFAALWGLLVYAPIAHWVWGGGWLQQMGVMDFAGGLVVHLTAGASALVAALVLGARRNFPGNMHPPHNMTMALTGAGMLWVGWFGFNAGSALAANGDAGMALLCTHLAASAGAFTWMCAEWVRYGKPSALGAATGMVAGLGTITPASGFVGPGGAVVLGILAGLVCFNVTVFLKQRLRIDDSLDVFPVHGVGGILGSLLVVVLAVPAFGGQGANLAMMPQLKVQLIGVAAVFIYTAAATFVLLKLCGLVVPWRVSAEVETEGLDVDQHNESGYSL